MYKLSGSEKLVRLSELPSPGTPSYPLLLSGEHYAVLAYEIARSESDWRPTTPELDLGGEGSAYTLVLLRSPSPILWTPFCQEGLGQHPLAAIGLRWFSAYMVNNSPLVETHPVLKERHLVFQFEDSTLDIVCDESISAYRFCGTHEEIRLKVCQLYLGDGA